jgi:hypothetical protein
MRLWQLGQTSVVGGALIRTLRLVMMFPFARHSGATNDGHSNGSGIRLNWRGRPRCDRGSVRSIMNVLSLEVEAVLGPGDVRDSVSGEEGGTPTVAAKHTTETPHVTASCDDYESTDGL